MALEDTLIEQATQIVRIRDAQLATVTTPSFQTAIEHHKAELGGDGLRILERMPEIIRRGSESLTPAEKDLLKWVGVFFRKPTPGKFMMRIRMPNGFASSVQLRAVGDLSRRLGNHVLDITTRQQLELRGFTLDSVPEIWEKLRGVDLGSLQTGMDNVRNINGCPLAGVSQNELLDASAIVQEIDRIMVGATGNPEFTNLPRKLNITVTGCVENCSHNESQDIALVPARKHDRVGFNVLVGGKMGSGGFTLASPLDVFIEPSSAVELVVELVKIYRDHGPREARSKARFAFLIAAWGIPKLREELETRLGRQLPMQGADARRSDTASHLGITQQKQADMVAVGLCVPTGRMNAGHLEELAQLAENYGRGQVRFTTGQNVLLPYVPANRIRELLNESLLKEFSVSPSPFFGGLVACVGTDYCNLALIETKRRASELSSALEQKLGQTFPAVSMHWSGCPAGCGNHQASDIGFRGFKTKIDDKIVDAVAVYAGGRTGPDAVAGKQILATVPCDEKLPEVVAGVIQKLKAMQPSTERTKVATPPLLKHPESDLPGYLLTDENASDLWTNDKHYQEHIPRLVMREIIAIVRPEKWRETVQALYSLGIGEITQQRVRGRGRQLGLRYVSHAKGPSTMRYLSKRMLHVYVEEGRVELAIEKILSVNKTGAIGDGKIFVIPCDEMSQPLPRRLPLQIPSQIAISGESVAQT